MWYLVLLKYYVGYTTERDTTETTPGTGNTNRTKDTIREITKTGMTITKIDTGLTAEGDPTNTNTIETN